LDELNLIASERGIVLNLGNAEDGRLGLSRGNMFPARVDCTATSSSPRDVSDFMGRMVNETNVSSEVETEIEEINKGTRE
jgi:hypothetical protein